MRLLSMIAVLTFVFLHGTVWAQQGIRTPVAKTTTTDIGQPLEFPAPAEITSYVAEIPVGIYPFHTHPYQRVVYVLAGTLTVEEESGTAREYPAGSMVVEMRNVVHRPVNRGPDVVKLLVIDIAKPGELNQLPKK
jgi:quercetin dioxygenase-like cupin family protein